MAYTNGEVKNLDAINLPSQQSLGYQKTIKNNSDANGGLNENPVGNAIYRKIESLKFLYEIS